jgi:predicted phosphodiesterase
MYFVASDIHLEFYPDNDLVLARISQEIADTPKEERLLFLCGDIGHPQRSMYGEFIKFCSENFERVMIITGNHEYYNCTDDVPTLSITEIDDVIDLITQSYDNVFFLNNSYCILKKEKLIVLGSTLWSKQEPRNYIKDVNDFNYIVTDKSKETNSNISLKEYDDLHNNCVQAIVDKLVEITDIREQLEYADFDLIVMTHHLPSYRLIASQYQGNPINQFFATKLDYLFEIFNCDPTSFIKYWFAGHTHSRIVADIHKTKVIVHPYGYPGECMHKDTDGLLKQIE